MSLHAYLPEQIHQSHRQVQIFDLVVRDDIQKEADEFEQVEAFSEVLREEFDDLNLMFFDIGEDGVDTVLFNEGKLCLIG